MVDRRATVSDAIRNRLGAACGVELDAAELVRLTDAGVAMLLALIDRHKVIVVRGAHLTVEEHLNLSRCFGSLQLHPYLAQLRSPEPHILVMEGPRALAHSYHSDETFLETPPATCILRMHTLPESGGDTTWINLEAAYAALSRETRARLATATAIHRTLDGDREACHPVVRAHPRTGRPSLFINRLYTRALDCEGKDMDLLLAKLLDHSEDEAFSCQLKWSPGDIAIWDNCCTSHRVAADFTTYRRVERIAVAGGRPERFGG